MGKKITIITETPIGKRKLVKFIECGSGDIRVIPQFAQSYVAMDNPAPDVQASELDNKTITEKRYSIHKSPASTEGVNTLKLTMTLEGGRKFSTYHITKAIKSGRIAPLFCKRPSGMYDSCYDVKKSSTTFSLGAFDPEVFTLVYTVLVAAPSTHFKHAPNYTYNCHRIDFSSLSVIILWSFFQLPSHKISMILEVSNSHLAKTPEETRRISERLMEGNNPKQSKELYELHRIMLREELIHRACSEGHLHGYDDPLITFVRKTGFFRSGIEKSPEHTARLASYFRRRYD